MRFRLLTLSLIVVATATVPSEASAHTHRLDGSWYFDGMTHQDGERKDPVNFIFAPGPFDDSTYDRDRIEQHMSDDWNHKAVGGSGWRTNGRIRKYCTVDQRMYWENGSERTSDKTDWHGSTARFGGICGRQHHARFWDDQEHARQVSGHGREDQWAVGGIHWERAVPAKPVTHKPARDWDVVRRELVRAMGVHCSESAWRYHPEADGVIQGYHSYGLVARISLRHRASGSCEGY